MNDTDDFAGGNNGTYHLPSVVLKMVSCSIVSLLTLVGNVLVIVIVLRVTRMKTTTYYLIVNMSVSDILFLLVAMPLFMQQIVDDFPIKGGGVGAFLCKFINPSSFGLMASSVLTMTAIAVDRFLAVKRPLQVVMGITMLKRTIVLIWALSLSVSLPMVFAYKLRKYQNIYYCDENWSDSITDNEAISRMFTVILFIIIYLVPFTTMGVLYIVIAHHLWCTKIPGPFHPVQRYFTVSRRKVVRMLVAVWICFIMCWLPLQIITFLVYFSEDFNPSADVVFAAEFLIRANGAINPFIYLMFSRSFRKATSKAFPMCFKK